MRDLRKLDRFRDRSHHTLQVYGSFGDHANGVFRVTPPASGMTFLVIASNGGGWEHVSVSLPFRTPTWEEVDYIKRLFFRPDETVMQLHVPEAEHVDISTTCLHLWRPTGAEIPRPPAVMV